MESKGMRGISSASGAGCYNIVSQADSGNSGTLRGSSSPTSVEPSPAALIKADALQGDRMPDDIKSLTSYHMSKALVSARSVGEEPEKQPGSGKESGGKDKATAPEPLAGRKRPDSSNISSPAKSVAVQHTIPFQSVAGDVYTYLMNIQYGNTEAVVVPATVKSYLEAYFNMYPQSEYISQQEHTYEAWPYVIHPALPGARLKVKEDCSQVMRSVSLSLELLLMLIASRDIPEDDKNYQITIRRLRNSVEEYLIIDGMSHEMNQGVEREAIMGFHNEGSMYGIFAGTAITPEALEALGRKQVSRFTQEVLRNIHFEMMPRRVSVPYTKPCSSKHSAFVEVVKYDLGIDIIGHETKTQFWCRNCSKEEAIQVKMTMCTYLDHLAKGRYSAACVCLRDFARTPAGKRLT